MTKQPSPQYAVALSGSAYLRRSPRRPVDPRRFLEDPSLVGRIHQQLAGAPWDVFTTCEVSAVLAESLNPITLNDYVYQRTPYAPPREPLADWRGNIGYYRKDVLLGWAISGGRPVRPWGVWQLSADYLSEVLKLRHPWTLRQTEEDIQWALERGLVSLRARPRSLPFSPFTSDPLAAHPEWGAEAAWPMGLIDAQPPTVN